MKRGFFLKCELYGEKPRKGSGNLKPCGVSWTCSITRLVIEQLYTVSVYV